MPSRKVVRPDDGRVKANLPPSRRAKPKPVDQKSRWQKLIDGDITVEDLDWDEVMAGKCKDKNGKFSGRPPDMMPKALLQAFRKEMEKRIQTQFDEGLEVALATLQDVMLSRLAAAPARVRAAEVWIERTVGKVPDKTQMTVEIKPFEENIEGLLVDTDTEEDNVYSITDKTA